VTAHQPHQARIREILQELGEIGYALPGSVVTRSTACGKPVCRCKADPPELHGPYVSWIRKSDGKPITRKLTPDQEQRYRPWFDNARRLRELLAELESLSLAAFEQAEGPRERRKS
jgi:hypothetical protein